MPQKTRPKKTTQALKELPAPARRTSIVLSQGAQQALLARQLPGESTSAAISRLIERLDTIESVLRRTHR